MSDAQRQSRDAERGETSGGHHPIHVPRAVEQNIRDLVERHNAQLSQRPLQIRLADSITGFSGSMRFIWIHVLWFGSWILINVGVIGLTAFDPYPFGMMTTIVSLEAIFLTAFVLLSQNRMQAAADRRAELDLHINLLAEREATLILAKLARIEAHLQLNVPDSEEHMTRELMEPTRPIEVLKEIERDL